MINQEQKRTEELEEDFLTESAIEELQKEILKYSKSKPDFLKSFNSAWKKLWTAVKQLQICRDNVDKMLEELKEFSSTIKDDEE